MQGCSHSAFERRGLPLPGALIPRIRSKTGVQGLAWGHFAGCGAGGLIFAETPKDLQLGFGRLGYGRNGVGADDNGVLVAGFEAFESL